MEDGRGPASPAKLSASRVRPATPGALPALDAVAAGTVRRGSETL